MSISQSCVLKLTKTKWCQLSFFHKFIWCCCLQLTRISHLHPTKYTNEKSLLTCVSDILAWILEYLISRMCDTYVICYLSQYCCLTIKPGCEEMFPTNSTAVSLLICHADSMAWHCIQHYCSFCMETTSLRWTLHTKKLYSKYFL